MSKEGKFNALMALNSIQVTVAHSLHKFHIRKVREKRVLEYEFVNRAFFTPTLYNLQNVYISLLVFCLYHFQINF